MHYGHALKSLEQVAATLDEVARGLESDDADAIARSLVDAVRHRCRTAILRLAHERDRADRGLTSTYLFKNDEGEFELREYESGRVVAVFADEAQAKLYQECSQVFEGLDQLELQALSCIAESAGFFDRFDDKRVA